MAKQYKKRDQQQEITDKLVALIEGGKLPWRKPWTNTQGVGVMPSNAVSGADYNGINIVLLWMTEFNDNRWLTYKQAKDLGGNVIKGEKSQSITFYSQCSKETINSEGIKEKSGYSLLKFYNVFNIEQCENLNMDRVKGSAPAPLVEPVEAKSVALDVAIACGAKVRHGGNTACFIPSADLIKMPDFEQFDDGIDYANTLLHELTHWTGHRSRLDRKNAKRHGDATYAFEELIAELGSAFLCAEYGVELREIDHASYLQSWLKALKNDSKFIFQAAAAASKAQKLIREKVASKAAISVAA